MCEFGIGDIIVGKYIGWMMSMFGGWLGVYCDGLVMGDFDGVMICNLYCGVMLLFEVLVYVCELLIVFNIVLVGVLIVVLLVGDLL